MQINNNYLKFCGRVDRLHSKRPSFVYCPSPIYQCFKHKTFGMADLVGVWEVSLSDGIHTIKFEHGTTTGKRVITVDEREVLRRNWMFKLVGKEHFKIGKTSAYVSIEAVSGFAYEYTMFVDNKPLKKFVEDRKRTARVWTLILDGVETRIVLGKDIFSP